MLRKPLHLDLEKRRGHIVRLARKERRQRFRESADRPGNQQAFAANGSAENAVANDVERAGFRHQSLAFVMPTHFSTPWSPSSRRWGFDYSATMRSAATR